MDVRAVGLTNGKKKGVTLYPDDGEGIGWVPMISRESTASFSG